MARGTGTAEDVLYGSLEARSLEETLRPSAPDTDGRLVMLLAEAEEDAWRIGWIGSRYSIYMRGPNGGAVMYEKHPQRLIEEDLRDEELQQRLLDWNDIPARLKKALLKAEIAYRNGMIQEINTNTVPVLNRPGSGYDRR